MVAGTMAAPQLAHADVETCSFAVLDASKQPTYEVQKVEYFHAPSNTDPHAWRCDWNTGRCSLSGWMISRRVTSGNQPAIIFEHGSAGPTQLGEIIEDDQSLTSYSCPIKRFVDAGYVVFMPYRRGTFDATAAGTLPFAARGAQGWSNSGWAAQDWAVWSVQNQGADMNIDNYVGQYIHYLQAEVADLIPAITTLDNFVRPDMTVKLVDPTRVAVAGHSIGGAFTTFAGTDDDLYTRLAHGPKAFISLSGAAMSYHESFWWHDMLTSSAALRNAPLMFTRALDEDARQPNDFASARDPFNAAGGFPNAMALFSPVNTTCTNPNTPSYQCAHGAFVTNSDQIDRWFPSVRSFLNGVGM
jgi:hypothetical protein